MGMSGPRKLDRARLYAGAVGLYLLAVLNAAAKDLRFAVAHLLLSLFGLPLARIVIDRSRCRYGVANGPLRDVGGAWKISAIFPLR